MAAEQNRPASPKDAPDPSDSYERSHPENEAGMGRLDNNGDATPSNVPDRQNQTVSNVQDPSRQINAEDDVKKHEKPGGKSAPRGAGGSPAPASEQPDHSMHDEEPDGWDQAPNDIQDPRQKRHPRTEGKGGTP